MNVDAEYKDVLQITRREAKNFAYGIMVLPRDKRRAIAAIYAFAREVDDIADGDLSDAGKREELESLHLVLETVYSESASLIANRGGPSWAVALADSRVRFAIPSEALHALVDGGLQDLEQEMYADFADLRGYCEKVAGAVGLACLPVYGSSDTAHAETHAMELGIALQLINIIRDVAEDRQLGRVYLPQDELTQFGVNRLEPSPEFRDLMAFQAQRARVHLAEGLELLASLDRRSALCVRTFAELYRSTLDRIEANGYDVFHGKTRLSTPAKLAVVARGIVG